MYLHIYGVYSPCKKHIFNRVNTKVKWRHISVMTSLFFNSSFRLTSNGISKLHIIGVLWEKPLLTRMNWITSSCGTWWRYGIEIPSSLLAICWITGHRFSLQVDIVSRCDDDYYGSQCELHCGTKLPDQHYRCHRLTGEKICDEGWGLERFKSSAPAKCGSNFRNAILKLIRQNSGLSTRCEIASICTPQNRINEKSNWFR